MKCLLCEAIKKEKPIYEDKKVIILKTKNMKGHHKRIMIISKQHIRIMPNERKHLEFFKDFCFKYFDEEPTYALVDSTYATIPYHWHKIACDWFGKKDIKQLHYTPHIALPTKVRWEP